MVRSLVAIIAFAVISACSAPVREASDWKDLPFQVHSAVETSIDLARVYFNSRDTACRNPYGAVVQGTPVTLNFRAKTGDLTAVNLVLTKKTVFGNNDNQKNTKISNLPMRLSTNLGGQDVFTATVSLPDIGVYGYYFELSKGDADKLVYGNNFDNVDIPYVQVKGTGGFGRVTMADGPKWPYVLTVFTNAYPAPAWSSNMVIYYIFPDRFRNGNKANDPIVGVRKFYGQKEIEFHTNWWDPYPWVPGRKDQNGNKHDKEYCNDFYGGDLDGIIEKLDYLADLGVNVIYINPIFQAPSNHKYDTADYLKVDESFGDLATFEKLVAEAKKRGIRIVLDTSLNHCGSDSVYMDRYGKYPGLGAFKNEQVQTNSPYFSWFTFTPKAKDADHAYSQWANPTLATLKEVDGWKDFAYRASNSVTKYWLSKGIGGWRMDVTPWKSDQFWREWRAEIMKSYPDAVTFAEVWFDASKYLLGDMYDSTMNYIFRSAAITLVKGGGADKAGDALAMMSENYPAPAFNRCMNLISSHDLPRLAYEIGYTKYGTNWSAFRSRVELAMALQFTFPGAPTIYYGDEIGMTGGPDPDNRGPYPWADTGAPYGDPAFIDVVKGLSKLRASVPALSQGTLEWLPATRNVLAFARAFNNRRVVVLLNGSGTAQEYAAPDGSYRDAVSSETLTVTDGGKVALPAWGWKVLVKI